ncbi:MULTISPECIES: DUF983 domain-containing protein [Sphingobium]|uniref:DUF983 domain-containing protein n=1 Tax=Sphingobium baderi TaxID=1332080 RepID=A0A0S3EWY2_9SPHN|nr:MULTISPECIES: DUF983 domain-containing protein [Sphingobium]ALR19924.1 hypothetical protein ATN00_05970 [Sphingobium baderi]
MTTQNDPPSALPMPLLQAAAKGACPRCSASTIFAGPVRFASSCRQCGLDYEQFNVGDGPAAFLTLIVGAVIVTLALVLELKVHPPLWLHVLLWTPLIVLAVMGSLRLAKGALLILEYRNKAREGRIMDKSDA